MVNLDAFHRQMTLTDVLKYYQHKGLVGEEQNAILQTLLAIKRLHFGIESLSGGGKSATMDLLANKNLYGDDILLPPSYVFILGMGSRTSKIHNQDTINKSKLLYCEELQKAATHLEVTEMLKNLAEGKDFSYEVTGKMFGGKIVNVKTITKNKGIMYTLAIENKHKNDAEMKRRFISLTTDVSEQQTRRVLKRKAQERFAKERLSIMEMDNIQLLKNHVKDCMDLADTFVYENPYAEQLQDYMPIPDQKVRSFITHYFNVIEAVTLFHYKERHKFKQRTNSKKVTLISNIEDCYLAHLLYAESFMRDIYSIPPIGYDVLKCFAEMDYSQTMQTLNDEYKNQVKLETFNDTTVERKYASVMDVHNHLKKHSAIVLKMGTLRNICDELTDAGFLMKDTSSRPTQFMMMDDPQNFVNNVNWPKVFTKGLANMHAHRHEHYTSWKELQQTLIDNPLNNNKIDIQKIVPDTGGLTTTVIKNGIRISTEQM